MSVAYAYCDAVLYVRIFDGERYVFPLPFMLTEDADLTAACKNLSIYARRELIPLIISDVPREELDVLTGLFRYLDASCYGDDEDTFFVKVNNECDECDVMPELELDGILASHNFVLRFRPRGQFFILYILYICARFCNLFFKLIRV